MKVNLEFMKLGDQGISSNEFVCPAGVVYINAEHLILGRNVKYLASRERSWTDMNHGKASYMGPRD